jgi:hypothetical protein
MRAPLRQVNVRFARLHRLRSGHRGDGRSYAMAMARTVVRAIGFPVTFLSVAIIGPPSVLSQSLPPPPDVETAPETQSFEGMSAQAALHMMDWLYLRPEPANPSAYDVIDDVRYMPPESMFANDAAAGSVAHASYLLQGDAAPAPFTPPPLPGAVPRGNTTPPAGTPLPPPRQVPSTSGGGAPLPPSIRNNGNPLRDSPTVTREAPSGSVPSLQNRLQPPPSIEAPRNSPSTAPINQAPINQAPINQAPINQAPPTYAPPRSQTFERSTSDAVIGSPSDQRIINPAPQGGWQPRGVPMTTNNGLSNPTQPPFANGGLAPSQPNSLNDQASVATMANSPFVSARVNYPTEMGWSNQGVGNSVPPYTGQVIPAGGVYAGSTYPLSQPLSTTINAPVAAAPTGFPSYPVVPHSPATPPAPFPVPPPASNTFPTYAGGGYAPDNAGFRPLVSLGQQNYPAVLGRGIYGQPTAYVPGQNIRNLLRYMFP